MAFINKRGDRRLSQNYVFQSWGSSSSSIPTLNYSTNQMVLNIKCNIKGIQVSSFSLQTFKIKFLGFQH